MSAYGTTCCGAKVSHLDRVKVSIEGLEMTAIVVIDRYGKIYFLQNYKDGSDPNWDYVDIDQNTKDLLLSEYKESWVDDSDVTSVRIIGKFNSKNFMTNIIKSFSNLFISEPEKSFRKAGITDESGIITDEGSKVFISWLLKKNGDAFKTEVVDSIIEEEKDSK